MEFLLFRDRQTALCYARDQGLTYTQEGKVHTKPDSAYEKLCYPKKTDELIKGFITHVRCSLVLNCMKKCYDKNSQSFYAYFIDRKLWAILVPANKIFEAGGRLIQRAQQPKQRFGTIQKSIRHLRWSNFGRCLSIGRQSAN